MNINEMLSEKGITKYRLSKSSGVPYTTISDISSGKSRIEKCSGETLYRMAKALDVSMEELLEAAMKENTEMEFRDTFDNFKSNVCHRVKGMGDKAFIDELIESDEIRQLYDKQWFPESLYLLAMLDYLCRESNMPLYAAYDDMRFIRLQEPVFPSSIIAKAIVLEDNSILQKSFDNAIPEFKRFNIVENEVRNVV